MQDVDPHTDKANMSSDTNDTALDAVNNVQEKARCTAPPTVLLLEEYLEGKFTKWNTNTGQVRSGIDVIPQVWRFLWCPQNCRVCLNRSQTSRPRSETTTVVGY